MIITVTITIIVCEIRQLLYVILQPYTNSKCRYSAIQSAAVKKLATSMDVVLNLFHVTFTFHQLCIV